uniref:uncharacterized protein tasor2 isoform X2 n=1 Tax=Gasterosteus aculeatus aculeatus TaxID=481459 RepID=UPI001A99A68F|nr:uncharacterized protein tasor2 isoform X2 [Gasterosteus aculeatus aculeatus]
MESGNGGAPSKGVLIPASERTGIFQSSILTTLKSAYLYEESKQSFRYTSAVLVENPTLEEKYNAFRKKRKEVGYSEEELKESYGFLLFDDIHKANALGQTGVLTGNSTCTTLGDPSKGVYISMYSDCLDLNCWYHEKSGYIAIIRLTKGRVKKVLENYTQNYNAPTVGFDCHVSEQLPSVSSETSSFLAFERTQYYVYELLDDAHIVTAQSPSAAFPIAIVSFLYTDTKATLEAPLKKCEEKKLVYQYFPWRGQLQISTQVYDVGLRSTAGALIPALLSPVVKIDRAISMFNLRQLLPRAVFETCFSGEVCLDGLYFSQCEFVSTEVEESYSLSLLLREIKEKDLALIIQLNDGGFLILLHSSHFVQYDDIASSGTDVLQGMFVFPNTRGIHTDANFQERKLATSSEILQVLPVLSYAESKVEKTPIDPSEELCEVFTQHMQTYAALINPGLASSPSREISIFPDQYDVPAAHKHLYSSPEWTNKEWESVGSYLRKPDSFQLQVSKATEILMSGQEQRMEDLDDDVYIYLSSPEGPQTQPDSIESEDWLEQSPANVETPVDSCITSSESKVNSTTVPQNVLLDDVKAGDDTGISDPSVPIETDDLKIKNLLTPSTSDDLPAELIVSLTSAENAVTGEGLTMISNVSAAKHNDFQLSVFSTAKLQTEGVNSLNEEGIATKQVLDCPPVTNLTKTKRRKLHRGHYKRRQKLSKACFETPSSQMQAADDNWSPKKYRAKKSLGRSSLSLSKIDQRKVQMRKCKSSQLSSKNESLSSASAGLAVPDEQNPWTAELERTIFMDFEDFPLRKKTERSDLKPVISECGRILVPHGSVDFGEQIKSLTVKLQSRKDEQCPEKTSANAPDTMVQESSAAPETAVGEAEATSQDGGNQLHVVHDRPPDDGNGSLMLNPESGELYLKTDVTATPPSETVKGILSQGNLPKNSEFLFSKLKSVLERKRKTDLPSSDETTADTAPCLKKVKVDSHAGILKSSYANSCVQDTSLCVKEVSKMSSVDPIFAFALGLTPKWTVDKIQKPEGQETQQKETISDKPPQILNRPSPIFPRGGRIKTLKRHQGISTESVKKKWWLHFQTPACYASEKLKDSGRANSVRKTVKENINSACSSTDALSLLADLALRAGNDQVLPQPDPALERETETSLKKCDLSKDLTCAEQESVLPSLLTQPAAKPMQPLQSTSPNHLVESSEWVGLVSKEHAYSSPPSSSLLLGLPGTPFQVSPLSGSSRLLRHHQTMYGNGIKILHPSVVHERSSEENQTIPGFLKKNIVRRRKFRHSRTFENKDGSIQVTKQWEETYDFNLDSKFTNDSKDRTIVRALHGPWDFSLQDTSEEVLLIVHMWIGLFYSRSTARFFHVGSCQHSEERDPLEMSRQTGSVSLLAPFSSIPDTDSMLDPGSAILDLSPRNSNAEKVSPDPQANRKETVPIDPKEANETLNALELPVGPQESITKQQSKKMVLSTEINEVNDVRSSKENTRTCTELQNALSLENANVQPWKGDGTIVSVGEEMETVYVEPENNQKASGVSDVLNGCNIEQTDTKDGIENSEATETSLVQTHGRDSSISLTDEEVDSNIELCDVLQTVEDDDTQPKDGENWESKENLYKEDHVETPRVICTNDHPTDKEFGIVCVGNVLDKKHLPTEEPKASSPGKPVNEEMEDEDQIGKEGGLDERDRCVPPVETDNDLSNQPVPMICDGVDSLQTDRITESNPKPPLVEQPPQAVNKEDACHDLQVNKLCANDCGLPVERDLSEKYPLTSSEIDHSSLLAFEKSYENEQITPFPMFDDNKGTDVSIPQTHDGVETGSHNNTMGNFNWRRHDHDDQDRKSIEGRKEVDDKTEKETFPHWTHVPLCETKVKLTDKKDVKQIGNMNEALAKIHSEIVIPFIGIDTSGEHTSVASWKGDGTIVSVGEEMETVYVEPENNQTASGVSDVLNGCNIEQTDTKDGIENSEETETSLVQTHGRDSSISLTDEEVDSNIELCDVLQTVEDDDTQPKDGEIWESKENLYKEDHVEPSSRVICTNDHPTDMEFGIVCVGNVLDKKHLPTEEPKASSPGKPVNEEMEDEDQIGKEDGLDDKTEKEPFPHWTNVPLCETKVQLTDEKDFKQIGNTDEALAKSHSKIVIPFIGIDTSGEDSVQFHDPHSQGKVEVVQAKEEIPFISETVLNSGVCGTPQKDIRKAQLSVGKLSLSLNDVSNTNHLGSGSISRCSTPTMDEKPFEYLTRSGPSNTSAAFSGSKTKSMTQKPFSGGATAAKNEMPPRCTVNCFASPHHNIPPDIELRTIKVLQSLDKLLQKSSETSSRIEKADKRTLHEAANPRSKNITTCFAPSHTSYDFKDEKIGNTVPAVVSASSSRELNTESTGHFPISPLFKLEELLGAKLQLQQIAASVPHSCSESDKMHETTQEQVSCQPYRSVPSPESLPASIVNQETHKTTSQTNSSNEPRLCSQRPVMAVKPSKSDESQGDNISKGRQIEKAVVSYFSKDLQNTNPKVTYTVPTTSLLVKSAERVKQTSEGVNDVKPDACELSSKSSWLTNFSVSSPLPVWCFTSAKGSSNLDDASVKEVGQLTETSIQIKRKDHSFASTSHADKNPLLGPQSSLICTVNNPTRNQSSNLLEQVSQRCVQNDPTEASMEQECLIFSETMKQLMKRSKRGPVSQRDMHDKRNFTCASPLTVHFNCLDVQGDSEDNLNTLLNTTPLVGQKIKVEMPERKNLAHFKEEQNTLQVYNISQGAGNLMEHPGIAGVTSECSRLYKAMMNDVCAVRKVPSRPKHFTMDRGYPTTEPGNHFDFCDQMKKELDESFRSNLNSVVKKSCKTKYRFYILVTSDVAFFQETKAQLEAEGHTAVQPSQFFLCEDGSSSLLIIIRNEDIAEHILEVPHLLRLKTSPGVQFAGIDEPDDVVNLTHQELFKRGGFVMFDSAALELLSLCNMKKMSELLQELSRTGKWKWMMHYRDSRRLKENARISKEAKEKKLFLNVCQEGGILEVLPYHECDLMSRDLPDYRTCLVRLQVQNISARYPVFITDKATESAFGENGILTMTFQSFLAYSQSKTFAG